MLELAVFGSFLDRVLIVLADGVVHGLWTIALDDVVFQHDLSSGSFSPFKELKSQNVKFAMILEGV
jgi:hypothetical protein